MDDENWIIEPSWRIVGLKKHVYFHHFFHGFFDCPQRTSHSHAFNPFPACVSIAKDKKPSISKQFKAFSVATFLDAGVGPWVAGRFFWGKGIQIHSETKLEILSNFTDLFGRNLVTFVRFF